MDTHKLCILITAILLQMACGSGTRAEQEGVSQPGKDTPQAWKTIKGVAVSTAESLDKSEHALEEIDRVMSQKTVPLGVALASAEAAFLLDAPSKAIAIMERAVQEYRTEKMPGVQFPAVVVGNFWIGTFARHAGDANRAEAAYRDILSELKTKPEIKGPSVLAAMCYLYLAEIENHFRNRPEKAALLLKELTALSHPKEQQADAVFRVYLQWGQYLLASLEAKDTSGNMIPAPAQPPYGDWSYVPDLHSVLVGLGDPADLQRNCGTKSAVSFFRCSLRMILESRASPIDVSIAETALGHEYERKNDLAMARKYYDMLFKSNSFFAPRGGIALARCWKDDSKMEEGKKILQEVARRFPKYKVMANQLLKDWFGESKTQ